MDEAAENVSPSDSAAAVLGVLIVLAVLGLQIYLIYAIIATRQDVRVIRGFLGGGRGQGWQAPPQSGTGHSWERAVGSAPVSGQGEPHQVDCYSQDQEFVCRTCGFTTRQKLAADTHRFKPTPLPEPGVYEIVLLGPGSTPHAVREFLESRLNYEQSTAAMMVVTPGARILRTRDYGEATAFVEQLRGVGGIAEVRGTGPGEPQAPVQREATSVNQVLSQELKTCPDCAEEVRAIARKCRFCGHVFEDVQPPLSS